MVNQCRLGCIIFQVDSTHRKSSYGLEDSTIHKKVKIIEFPAPCLSRPQRFLYAYALTTNIRKRTLQPRPLPKEKILKFRKTKA